MSNGEDDKNIPTMEAHQTSKKGSSRSCGDEWDQLTSTSVADTTAGQKRDVSQLGVVVNPPSSEFHEKGTSKRQTKMKPKNEETMKPPPVASAISNNEDVPSNMSLQLGSADAEALPAAAAASGNSNLEHSRAMSRIYSQRNRDKQKRQIQDLAEAKIHLDRENTSLRIINQDYMTRFRAARAENDVHRQQQQLSNQIAAATGTAAPLLPSPMAFASTNHPPQQLPRLRSLQSNEEALLTTASPHQDHLLNLAATLVQLPLHQSLPSQQSQQQQQQLSVAGRVPGVLSQPLRSGTVPIHQEITALDNRIARSHQEGPPAGIPSKKASDSVKGNTDEKSSTSTIPSTIHIPQMTSSVDRSQNLDNINHGGRWRGDQQNDDEDGREESSN